MMKKSGLCLTIVGVFVGAVAVGCEGVGALSAGDEGSGEEIAQEESASCGLPPLCYIYLEHTCTDDPQHVGGATTSTTEAYAL